MFVSYPDAMRPWPASRERAGVTLTHNFMIHKSSKRSVPRHQLSNKYEYGVNKNKNEYGVNKNKNENQSRVPLIAPTLGCRSCYCAPTMQANYERVNL